MEELGLSWARAPTKILSQPLMLLDFELPNTSALTCKYLGMDYYLCVSYAWTFFTSVACVRV